MMKKTLIATALLAGSSAAMAEISGNVALTTDYVFRGISQTDNQMAIQGGFDWAHDSGLYVGTWASSVDPDFFNGTGHDPQIELDLYAGYSGELGNGIGYDLGYLRYEYPGYNKADTNEIYIKGSFNNFSASVNYSDELAFLPSTESAWYIAAGYDMELPADFALSLHIGYSFGDAFDVSPGSSETGLGDSYTDWSIGVSKAVYGVDLGLTYTDLSDLEDPAGNECKENFCDSKIVFSVSKSL